MTSRPIAEALEDAFAHCRDMDASLSERLETLAGTVRTLSPPFAECVDRLVTRLRQTEVGAAAPRPGDQMPAFVLPDENGRLVALDSLLSNGPVAVTFHRGHWCPYCRINTAALAKAHEEIAAEGGQVVAIMPDRQQFAAQFKAEAKAPFPVLTDLDNGYALSLNLTFWVGDEMARFIAAAARDVSQYQGNKSWMLPIPATFVVGTDGRVAARFVDPDYRKRMSIEELTAALKAAR
jgi:peroxiredoxin